MPDAKCPGYIGINAFVIIHSRITSSFWLKVNASLIFLFTNELTRFQTKSMEFNGREFWIRFDRLLQEKNSSIRALCSKTGLAYSTINTQRTRHTIPKAEYLYQIAGYLGVSIELLLTGSIEKQPLYISPEAQAVEDSPELQALVRAVMRDPQLLSALATVIESSERVNIG